MTPADQYRAAACHASGLLIFVITGVGGVLGTLIAWWMVRDRSDYLDRQGRVAVDFQITVMLAVMAGIGLLWVQKSSAFLLLGLIFALDLILIVIASVRAWAGEDYRYPFSLCLLQERA